MRQVSIMHQNPLVLVCHGHDVEPPISMTLGPAENVGSTFGHTANIYMFS